MTRQEVYKQTLDYFKGDILKTNIWIDKYCLRDGDNYSESTPDDMFKRIAKEFARIEFKYPKPMNENEVLSLLQDFKYVIPGGSMLYGVGNNYSYSSLGNCFVIGDETDSYGSIMKIDEEQVQLMKRRGGVGHDLSHLRPKGSRLSNAANTSTGAVSFMSRYSNSCREVGQDGRRGALMLSMSVDHPDIEDFITSKDDLTKITGANISVKITDPFMSKLDDRDEDAKRIWSKIIHQAWKSAEPGVLFWDTITKNSPADAYPGFKSISTNPCVSGDTKILTNNGYKQIDSVIGVPTKIWNGTEFSDVTPCFTGNTNDWIIIRFSDGSELRCTPNHKFYTKDGLKEAKDLLIGDKLNKFSFPIILDNSESINKDLYTHGFYCGDGSNKRDESIIDLYGIKKELSLYLVSRMSSVNGTETTRLYLGSKLDKNWVPDSKYNIKSRLSFLAGLIDSDGTINSKDGSINISSINREFLINIKYLLNTLGSTGTVSLMKVATRKEMPDGHGSTKKYNCKDCYRIVISATNVKKLENIGLLTHRIKLIANPNRDASRFIRIISIDKINVINEPTYCFNEQIKHKGIFNGLLTGQCGEIPLCAYDTCRLMSINMFSFVVNPFTPKAYFDIDKFEQVVYKAQRLMDDVIDLEEEKIDAILNKISNEERSSDTEINLWKKIKKKLLKGRRTGLSCIGLADTLAGLNIKYGSDESLAFCNLKFKSFHDTAYRSSEDMADQRGPFPTSIQWPDLDIPRRNIALLTIPPSGTISILAGVSSGIEPVFNLEYTRRRKVEESDNVAFVDKNGDKWEEYKIYHPLYEKYNKPLSYIGSTANEIDPMTRVDLQATIQTWIDHSISSTINLPKETTEEQIDSIYRYAYKKGCKGITIYREGCRDGVLINKPEKKETTFEYHDAPKRPKVLAADVKEVKVKGTVYSIIVGMLDNKPYEVFVLDYSIPSIKGEIVKNSSGNYTYGTINITDKLTDEQSIITRLVSTSLRHGTDIKFIVEQLNKTKGDLTSFGKAIARVLKQYIQNGSHLKGSDCPNCGSKLVMENGCEICKSCGSTKCS